MRLLEAETRTFNLTNVGPCDYALSFTEVDEVFQVSAWNLTEDRPVDLCGNRERFETESEDDAQWFWKTITAVKK